LASNPGINPIRPRVGLFLQVVQAYKNYIIEFGRPLVVFLHPSLCLRVTVRISR